MICKYCRNSGEVACASMVQAKDCAWMTTSDWRCLDQYKKAKPQVAIDILKYHQVQCDDDGVMVQVSRQALDELLTWLAGDTP